MSRFEPSAVRETATVTTRAMGYKGMKPEQLKVVEMFVRGNDVFWCTSNWIWKESMLCLLTFTI